MAMLLFKDKQLNRKYVINTDVDFELYIPKLRFKNHLTAATKEVCEFLILRNEPWISKKEPPTRKPRTQDSEQQ